MEKNLKLGGVENLIFFELAILISFSKNQSTFIMEHEILMITLVYSKRVSVRYTVQCMYCVDIFKSKLLLEYDK